MSDATFVCADLTTVARLDDLGRLAVGETVVECLKADLRLENEARNALVTAVTLCESTKDYVSREIVVDILEDAEEHIDFLETELSLVDKVGEPSRGHRRTAVDLIANGEIDLVGQAIPHRAKIGHVHFGGGTPTLAAG